METLARFGVGVAGATVVYVFMYRESRLAAFAKNPRGQWGLLVVDLFFFLLAGGLVATFVPGEQPPFLLGATWQGIAGGAASGRENDELRRELAERNERLTSAANSLDRRLRMALPEGGDIEEYQEAPEA